MHVVYYRRIDHRFSKSIFILCSSAVRRSFVVVRCSFFRSLIPSLSLDALLLSTSVEVVLCFCIILADSRWLLAWLVLYENCSKATAADAATAVCDRRARSPLECPSLHVERRLLRPSLPASAHGPYSESIASESRGPCARTSTCATYLNVSALRQPMPPPRSY